jgi:hypothetical protein
MSLSHVKKKENERRKKEERRKERRKEQELQKTEDKTQRPQQTDAEMHARNGRTRWKDVKRTRLALFFSPKKVYVNRAICTQQCVYV